MVEWWPCHNQSFSSLGCLLIESTKYWIHKSSLLTNFILLVRLLFGKPERPIDKYRTCFNDDNDIWCAQAKKKRNETLRSRNWWCVIVFCCCVSSFFRHHNLIVQFPNSVWFARFACRSTVCFCEIGWQGGGPNESTWLCTSVNTFYVKMMVQTDGLLLYDKYIMLEYIKEMASPKHSTRDDFRLRKPTSTHTQKERTSSEKIVFAFVFFCDDMYTHTYTRALHIDEFWLLIKKKLCPYYCYHLHSNDPNVIQNVMADISSSSRWWWCCWWWWCDQ